MLFVWSIILAVQSSRFHSLASAHDDRGGPYPSNLHTIRSAREINMTIWPSRSNEIDSVVKPVLSPVLNTLQTSDISASQMSDKSDTSIPKFTFTPPTFTQTLVSISLPPYISSDNTISQLGCRPATTPPAVTHTPERPPMSPGPPGYSNINLPLVRRDKPDCPNGVIMPPVFPKTEYWCATYAGPVPTPSIKTTTVSITSTYSGSSTSPKLILTSTLASDDPTSSASTAPTESEQASTTENPGSLPAPAPCSANTAQNCITLGGSTMVVDMWNGIAIAPTDSVLHSTATMTGQATRETVMAKSEGLRKTKSPMLLLVVCCIGAMLYELKVLTEPPEEKSETEKSTGKDQDEKMSEIEFCEEVKDR